ncbi:MAG: hypothetical protein L0Y72_31045 [Gemmataceae bacterium]|nr:hypothetical protein [Gemmataceae bacterium]MCI0743487.1 hypothetical protein [Gemmataceae bacterium]
MNDERIQERPPAESSNALDYASPPDHDRFLGSLKKPEEFITARNVFAVWELLRLGYNAILIVTVVALLGLMTSIRMLPALLEGALIANVCFCVGPVAEGYLVLLGVHRRIARALLFTAGSLLSVCLAIAYLSFPAWP